MFRGRRTSRMRYALEEALRQKEKHGGEVAAITAGPARSQQVLREALAKGADRAIHLEDDRFAQTGCGEYGAGDCGGD